MIPPPRLHCTLVCQLFIKTWPGIAHYRNIRLTFVACMMIKKNSSTVSKRVNKKGECQDRPSNCAWANSVEDFRVQACGRTHTRPKAQTYDRMGIGPGNGWRLCITTHAPKNNDAGMPLIPFLEISSRRDFKCGVYRDRRACACIECMHGIQKQT